jgi:hypothetical protein
MYAMVHIATHDALNAIHRRSKPYAFDARVASRTSVDAAIAAAARDVLVSVIGQLQEAPSCIENGIATADADYAAALAQIPDGPRKDRGIALGQAAARAILTLRTGDGSDTLLADSNYPQGILPGEYRFAPGLPFAFAPGWGNVTPFALKKGSQFRAGRPYVIDSKRYTRDFNDVKKLGRDVSTDRSPEQTEIGLFWVESSPFAWNRLARDISARFHLGVHANARLFGLLNMAMADGYIGSWEGKYHYNFWRPETAIQLGDSDGNPDTTGDPTWTPLHFTYPMPDQQRRDGTLGLQRGRPRPRGARA